MTNPMPSQSGLIVKWIIDPAFKNPALNELRAAQKRFHEAETYEEKMAAYRETRRYCSALLDKTKTP